MGAEPFQLADHFLAAAEESRINQRLFPNVHLLERKPADGRIAAEILPQAKELSGGWVVGRREVHFPLEEVL